MANKYHKSQSHGDWGLGPIPNPQSPIPNPQSPIPNDKGEYDLLIFHISV